MMPTRSSSGRNNFIGEDNRWTDALPICKESGIGSSSNCIYREDGLRQLEHEYEDQSFHFKCDDKTSMYGIFDGHDGYEVAKYALDTIAAEVLLNQLEDKISDEDVKTVLKNAFNAVERNYNASIDDKLAEKASLQMEIPENLTPYEAYQRNPRAVDRLNAINTELSCGSSAVVALIHLNRLYVANVGDSRALLCRTDQDGVLRVIQLSQDHVLLNEDEILRLNTLGIPRERIMKGFRLGSQEHTRCLGHYLVKGGYVEFEELACACSEPVIADPEITGGIPIESCHRFLILMSSGLYRSLEEATGTDYVNKDLVQMIVEQFRIQSTLTGVAQAVVDKVVRIHHDFYMNRTISDRVAVSKREDITLLIRNFNFPLPNARSPSCSNDIFMNNADAEKLGTSSSTSDSHHDTYDTNDSETNGSNRKSAILSSGRILPYVDFRPYYENVETAKLEGSLPEDIDFF
ncbi:hypothetical protein V9T40_003862 [Parthenolecanium corni]|uniref:TGF-beta-activated kinase 1 and MAP3K7-binding protein 1 n=1 Tax=Parthenolecanium corni TaxID=536013 RepID=A0AAN9U332_9HEMI